MNAKQPRAASPPDADFRTLFEALPGLFLVLTPELNIVAASDSYLQATMTSRDFLLGKHLFQAFPDNPDDPAATGTQNLRASLERVLSTRRSDAMAVQKYDVRRPAEQGGGFEERFWSPVNAPVLTPDGKVAYIIHRVEDVTEFMQLKRRGDREQERAAELQQRVSQADAEIFQRAEQLQAVNQELRRTNAAIQKEIADRKRSESETERLAEELRLLNEELESRVDERTRQLATAHHALLSESAERRLVQEQFQHVVESLPTATVVVDAVGQMVLVNEKTEQLFGYERTELLGKPVEILVPERLRASHPKFREEFLAQPETRPMGLGRELFGRRKDGREFPVEIGLNPYRTKEGTFVLAIVVDISERKRVEEAKRRSELRFRAIFNQTFELVGMLNTDGTVVEVNQPALDFRGLKHEEVVGRPVWQTPWFDISEAVREGTRQAIAAAAGGQFVRQEMTVRNSNGEPRTFDFSVKPVINGQDAVELLIVEARDITEQKRLEEQFRQSQKMEAVGQLAGGIAHDFNNLLTIITGYSELALGMLPAETPVREMIEEISKAGVRSASLTQQLLAFSRKQVLAPRVVNLNHVVNNIEKMLQRMIGEDIALTTKLDPVLEPVMADRGQIEQVLFNLAVNARDAMPHGGNLTLETSNIEIDEEYAAVHTGVRSGRYVQMSVTDSGQGMTADVRRRIFEPFFTTKETGKGTGLGLAVVHGIVKQSDGHIEVYSEPSFGTVFKIYLPAIEEPHHVKSKAAGPTPPPRGCETILLVEDEEGVRMLAQRALMNLGYSVLSAGHPAEAVRLSRESMSEIDLLLTDVVMPEMNGRRLAELLLAERPKMKVLYMSGYTDDTIVRQGILDAGVNFLHKPFAPAALATKVRSVLD